MSAEIKKINKKTTNIILLSIISVLLILYIVSFTKSCSSTDKREIVKTALVNKKYKDKITMFEIQGNGELITLSKKGDKWYVVDNYNSDLTLPASKEKIEYFINDLIKVINMYKISDKITKNSAFGLTDSSSFNIRYYYDEKFNDLIFGNQDFALSSRYMMSGKSTTVYEISCEFDKYLSTSVQSWTEPFIISQQPLGPIIAQDIQRTFITYDNTSKKIEFPEKILDLRHGGFPTIQFFSLNMFDSPLMELKLELGNKNQIVIKIAKSDLPTEQEYVVETNYINENQKSHYKSYCKISGWTYNKIKEVTL